MCCFAGPEFELAKFCEKGKIIKCVKALYGLSSSAARWRNHLADTFRGLGYERTVADPDAWIRADSVGYSYIGSHIDDLFIVGETSVVKSICARLKQVYVMKTLDSLPVSHLGIGYERVNWDGIERLELHCDTYCTEMLRKLTHDAREWMPRNNSETVLGGARLPIRPSLEPEMFASSSDAKIHTLLNVRDHRLYQQIVGAVNWAVLVGRLDVAFALSSLSRFSSAPRRAHMTAAIRMLQYLNKNRGWRIRIEPNEFKPLGHIRECQFKTNDWRKNYPDASESPYLDECLPDPRWSELQVSAFSDSDLAHDKVTRRSVTGMVLMAGSTPIIYSAKRQGCISAPTYSAELMAVREATVKVIELHLLMRSLGVAVQSASKLYCDNLGVFQSVGEGESATKRHTSIAYHLVP